MVFLKLITGRRQASLDGGVVYHKTACDLQKGQGQESQGETEKQQRRSRLRRPEPGSQKPGRDPVLQSPGGGGGWLTVHLWTGRTVRRCPPLKQESSRLGSGGLDHKAVAPPCGERS